RFLEFFVGRVGFPFQYIGFSFVRLAFGAPADEISALSGKIGRLAGVSAKVIYQKA
ncbi:iron-only hydrogenase system regulator, partial [Lachnotalea glycerini]